MLTMSLLFTRDLAKFETTGNNLFSKHFSISIWYEQQIGEQRINIYPISVRDILESKAVSGKDVNTEFFLVSFLVFKLNVAKDKFDEMISIEIAISHYNFTFHCILI